MTRLHKKTVRKICSAVIFFNQSKPKASRVAHEVAVLLKRRGVTVAFAPDCRDALRQAGLVVAVGGDGTMLRAARMAAPCGVPLLGINSGHLGFLTGADLNGFRRGLKDMLAGRLHIEERRMVCVDVARRGKTMFGRHLALNDCVIRCGEQARAILLEARLQGRFVADYFGDGLIVSTPTGSTAYALAASGPIVDPSLDVFLVAPICPHTLTQGPLIVPADGELSVKLSSRHAGDGPRVLVSLDGQVGTFLQVGDEVRVRRYERPLRIILDPGHSYFEILRKKLRWGST